MKSICGLDCEKCELNIFCGGCTETDGRPFGSNCTAAMCLKKGKDAFKKFKEKLIDTLNALDIQGMDKVTSLNNIKGSFANLEYSLPSGQKVKFWDNNKIYFGTQLHKADSDRCYGILADEKYLMVSEYGADGADAEIVVFMRWNCVT